MSRMPKNSIALNLYIFNLVNYWFILRKEERIRTEFLNEIESITCFQTNAIWAPGRDYTPVWGRCSGEFLKEPAVWRESGEVEL